MVQVPDPTSLSVIVPMMVPAAPWIWPGVPLTCVQAATPAVVGGGATVVVVGGGAAVVVVVRPCAVVDVVDVDP